MRFAPFLILLLAATAHGFSRSRTGGGTPIKWTTNCINFYLNEAGSEDVSFNEAQTAVTESFAQWDAVDCTDLQLSYKGITDDDQAGFDRDGGNRNIVIWRDGDGAWAAQGSGHARGVIALTTVTYCTQAGGGCPYVGAILDADIELNGDQFVFANTDGSRPLNRFDIRNTVTHEVGHFLGLDHSNVSQATMFASAPAGERAKFSLHADDIEGICEIHPARADGPTCLVTEGLAADDTGGCHQQPGRGAGPGLLILGLFVLLRRRNM